MIVLLNELVNKTFGEKCWHTKWR